MKKIKIKKIGTFFLISTVTVFCLAIIIKFSLPVFSQERNNSDLFLLTEPFLKIDAETQINAPISVKGEINLIDSQEFKGEIKVSGLTENRSYLFPNLSGEVCLSAGNCLLSPTGTSNRLAKFTAQGLTNSSIRDFSQEISIFIDDGGRLGIGMENPGYKLHVAGRIQASDDICTDLQKGRCLSELEKLSSLFDATVGGEGSANRIPLWKEDFQLGDSEIYQSGKNIGIGGEPAYKLDVAGTIRILGFRLPISPKEGYGLLSDETGFGSWQPVLRPLDLNQDIAENFLINPGCETFKNCPEPGDLVSINDNGFIEKSSIPYDSRLIGIISSEPAMILGGKLNPSQSRPIALIGQVPAKVSLENGPIKKGDFLTSSFVPGTAKKAIGPGRVAGMALESLSENDFQECKNENQNKESKIWDCEKRIGKINVLINLHSIY